MNAIIEEDESTLSKNDAKQFEEAFIGKFFGVLKWTQLDELWSVVLNDITESWYVYAIGDKPPAEPLKDESLKTVITELNMLLRREHDEEYCGIVYTDDLNKPSFIKVFDPNNVGTSCSIAKTPPLPGWIISKLPPTDLLTSMKQTAKRKRWWNKLFI